MVWLVAVRIPQGHNARVALSQTLSTQAGRVDQLSTLAAQNQAKLQALGQKPVGPDPASISAGKATAPPTEQAPLSPAPIYVNSIEPSQERVNTGVRVYFTKHPPKAPITAAQVVAKVVPYVTSYLKAHPAKPGKKGDTGASGAPCDPDQNLDCKGPAGKDAPPPSDEQVATAVQAFLPAAVAAYFTANPPPSGPAGPSGSPGPQGPKGDGPTQDQIAAAVNDYFTQHPLACQDGYTATNETVTTDHGPVLIQACVADDQPTQAPTQTEQPSTLPTPTESPS
jgi:hypothetical protein